MKKIIIQGLITVLLFFGIFLSLKQIDWVKTFKVKQVTDKTEEKLGDLFWDFYKKTERESNDQLLTSSLDSIVTHVCKANKIDRDKIKIHLLEKDEVNAFAIPNGHLVVYTGLIANSDNQEELAGVISHEIAHIQLNHVMKKLVKEVGLSVLLSMTTGDNGPQVIKETAKMLSSSAFDRSQEKEADIKAVDYLIEADLNPEKFANFLYKQSEVEPEAIQYLTWISTHPDSKERGKYIIEYTKGKKIVSKPVLSAKTWQKIKTASESLEEN